MSYSVLNNYEYPGKSSFISTLDTLSSPCRSILGGVEEDLLTGMTSHMMSTAMKITTLVISTLLFPVIAISVASFLLKLATFSFVWEKKVVVQEREKLFDVINRFIQAFDSNSLDNALRIVDERPGIKARADEQNRLFQIVNIKINDNLELDGTATLCKKYLSSTNTTTLMLYALSRASLLPLSADDIEKLANSSLSDINAVKGFYKKLLDEQLKLQKDDSFLLKAVKLDIGIQIIEKYIVLCTQTEPHYQNIIPELKKQFSAADRFCLRSDLIRGSNLTSLHTYISDEAKIQETHEKLSSLRRELARLKEAPKKQEETIQPFLEFLEKLLTSKVS